MINSVKKHVYNILLTPGKDTAEHKSRSGNMTIFSVFETPTLLN
jgi:hypothetical protein